MEHINQGNDPNSSSSVTEKRKRGRPRKYSSPNLSSGEHFRTPTGFEGVNANNIVVGQAVHGVIEATFDAGYLLTVKIGNTGTILRGAVFKPGCYLPVQANNDVAPNIQMIRRNEIPIPTDNSQRNVNDRSTPKSFQRTSVQKDTTAGNGIPLDNLLTEVLKKNEPYLLSADTQSEIDSELTGPSMDDDEDDDGVERALSIEPLQAVEPADNRYPASMSQHLESYGTGNMTELLQAVQEKMKEDM